MKKFLSIFIILTAVLLVFSSCVSTGIYNTAQEEIKSDGKLNVKVDGIIEAHTFMIYGFSMVSNKGVAISMENLSDSPLTINWDKSSISYGSKTSGLFLSDQKFMNAGMSIPPLTIPKNGKKSIEIYPSDNVSYDGEWKIGNMGLNKGEVLTLSINYEYDNENYFISVESSPKNGSFKWGF